MPTSAAASTTSTRSSAASTPPCTAATPASQGVAGEILVTDNVAPAELAQLQAQGVMAIVTASRQRAVAQRDPGAQPAPAAGGRRRAGAAADQRRRRAGRRRRQRPRRARTRRRRPARAPRAACASYARERKQLHRLRREPTRTLDGVDIKLYANAESREDVAEAHALGAAGVGLYRTEFLFLQRNELPDEEEQFRVYRDVVLGMTGRPVTIRTLDLGADKADRTGLALRDEPNPALGLRGVRLSLARDGAARNAAARAGARLRLRPAAHPGADGQLPRGSARGAQPAQARRRASCATQGHEIAEHVPLGAMIEVPAAAIALPGFIGSVDFLSIGTNDLVQYLLAADRNNEALGDLYTPLHPAVLRLLRDVIRLGQQARQAGGGVRRNGRRSALRAAAAGAGPDGVQPASGDAAGTAPRASAHCDLGAAARRTRRRCCARATAPRIEDWMHGERAIATRGLTVPRDAVHGVGITRPQGR